MPFLANHIVTRVNFIDQTVLGMRRAAIFGTDVIRNARIAIDSATARKSRAEVGTFTIEDLPPRPGQFTGNTEYIACLHRA